MEARKEILSFESLLIGYISGSTTKILLPPLKASAYQGELIAMIGQNGIGKSTLMRTLTGLQVAIDGTIIINGKSIKNFENILGSECRLKDFQYRNPYTPISRELKPLSRNTI